MTYNLCLSFRNIVRSNNIETVHPVGLLVIIGVLVCYFLVAYFVSLIVTQRKRGTN